VIFSINCINWLIVDVIETYCVFCEVRTEFLCRFAKLRILTISSFVSVRLSVPLSAWHNSPPTERIWMKLDSWVFFETLPRKLKVNSNRTIIRGTLHINLFIFQIISRSFFKGRYCREIFIANQNTFDVQLPFFELVWFIRQRRKVI